MNTLLLATSVGETIVRVQPKEKLPKLQGNLLRGCEELASEEAQKFQEILLNFLKEFEQKERVLIENTSATTQFVESTTRRNKCMRQGDQITAGYWCDDNSIAPITQYWNESPIRY